MRAPAIVGAQRLSASQTWSQCEGRMRSPRSKCAQRLSASQTWSHPLPLIHTPGSPSACAQRLSASQTWSRRPRVQDPVRSLSCSTPFGVTDLVTVTRSRAGTASRTCSTPFGVTDLVTVRGTSGMVPLAVLNAFRRHRLGHVRPAPAPSSAGVCSTPFGVTDLVTWWRTPTRGGARGAQRLSASQTWSRPPWRRLPRGSSVLNAFRRHRLGHRSAGKWSYAGGAVLNAFRRHRLGHHRDSPRPRCRPCAQRLSASQTWSRTASRHGESWG